MSWECYNEETNICDGRCQGASDCPLAQGLNISKRMMKLYIKQSKEFNKKMENIMNDPELQKFVNELVRRKE